MEGFPKATKAVTLFSKDACMTFGDMRTGDDGSGEPLSGERRRESGSVRQEALPKEADASAAALDPVAPVGGRPALTVLEDEAPPRPALTSPWPQRIELGGRIVAVAIGVLVVALLDEMSPWWCLLATLAWVVAVQSSFARTASALRPLGPGAPAALGAGLGLLLAIAAAFVLSEPRAHLAPILLGALIVAVLVFAWEVAYRRWIAPERRVLIVGWSAVAAELVSDLDGTGYRVVGVAVDPSNRPASLSTSSSIVSLTDLPRMIDAQRPDIIVLALERGRLAPLDHLLDAAPQGFGVLEAPQFFEHVFGRVPVSDLPRAWFLGILHLYRQQYSTTSKRTFDVLVASMTLILTAPLFPVLALLTKTSRGPVLVRQVRIGEHGKPFVLRKFRTMDSDAEASGEAVWSPRDDERVTRVGTFMRATRLDELPQLWNIIRGEMSIVGPRPERPEFIQLLESRVAFWSRRHLVKPGLSGWAQVSSGYAADSDQALLKLSYDLWYLRHRSLLVDLTICAKTLVVLFRGRVHYAKEAPAVESPATVARAGADAAVTHPPA
jgi:exopolysaccharide biosynthesis polyprenyl glycosylphosphotransferase